MKTQCVREQGTSMKRSTCTRISSTYKRIVLRMYVLSLVCTGSLRTHYPKNLSTYKIGYLAGECF